MFYKKIGFRKKILFVLLFLITALFVIYMFADVFFINKLTKANTSLYNEYVEYLTRTLEHDNLEKEEIFLKTIANYGVAVLKDPKDDVINSQLELGKFLCMFYNYNLLTDIGKTEIIKRYFVPKQNAGVYKNEKKHVFWGIDKLDNDLLNNSSDALFFTLDSLKILKQSNNSLIKSVFIKTINNLCIAYPVNSVLSLKSDYDELEKLNQTSTVS